ncbi:MAG TPA: hypothetical protein VGK20_15305 [Candidatus Binatia bacterium]
MSSATTTLQRIHNSTTPPVRSVGDAVSSHQSRNLHPVALHQSAVSPTLDSIAQNPQLALLLSPEDAAALSLSCAAVMAVLQQRSLAPITRPAEDRFISAEEVGKIINKSKSWVEHHHNDLPPRRNLAGNPGWLLSEVEALVKNAPRYGRAA